MLFSRRIASSVIVGLLSTTHVSFAQVNDAERALIDGAREQLTKVYLMAPLPCSDPWLAGDDNRIAAVPDWAQTEGLRPGDVLTSIGARKILAGDPDGWVQAMRALPKGLASFDVVVNRSSREVKVRLSCRSHVPYFEAERRVWTSISRGDWNGCASAAVATMDAFGKSTSPMQSIRLRCATAAKWETTRVGQIVYDYGIASVDEIAAAAPTDQPALRQAVANSISWLEKARLDALASELRTRLAQSSVAVSGTQQTQLTESQLIQIARAIAVGYGFNPDTPKGQIAQTWARELFSEPLVINHLSKLQRDEDPGSWAKQLVAEGVPFLPDLYLKRRMEIVLRMLQAASPTECAQIAGHSRYGSNDQGAAMKVVLPRLDETDVGVFLEVLREAMMVRLRQRQFAPYEMSEQESEGLMVLIAQAVPSTERDQWISQLERVDSITDTAYCEASKTMYRAILTLSGPHASRGLRFEFAK